MSLKLNIQTGRKKAISIMLKSIAEFWGGCPNERVSIQLEITALE